MEHTQTTVAIQFVDADGIRRHADEADAAALCLTRREVEAGLVGSAVERLMELSDSPAYVERFEASVILVIEGYEHDPRELWQIPEVCIFMRAVTKQWPYWAWFAMPQAGVPALVLSLLVDTVLVHNDAGRISAMAEDLIALDSTLSALHTACRGLCASAGLPPQRAEAAFARFASQ
jgi:hypothetical protein